jgi:diguanylate cyclase (GGDEF)-like protein
MTGVAVYYKDELLTRRVSINSESSPVVGSYFYGDQMNGGTSAAAPLSGEALAWSCSVRATVEFPYCGFGVVLTDSVGAGTDLSAFETVRVTLDFKGPGRVLRFYLKNRNPAYSRPGQPQRDKHNYVDVALVQGTRTFQMPLTQFSVPDWWKIEVKAPPALAGPEFTNLIGLDGQLGLDGRTGDYQVRLKEVHFERYLLSEEQFFSGLTVFWVGLVLALLWQRRRIAHSREQQEAGRLKWVSEHDPLTLLPNRRAFQSRLQAAALKAMDTGSSIGLLLVDLDHFKHVNDSFGHSAGDELLKVVSKRLAGALERNSFVARIGGDEFAIIVQGVEQDRELLTIGARICTAVKSPVAVGDRHVLVGASVGAAIFPRHAHCAGELINAADMALYALKHAGRGGTKLLDEGILQDARRTASQLSVARSAADDHRIVPHYQPIVDLMTREIIGFEALLRCNDSSVLQSSSVLHEAFADYELASRLADLMHRQVADDIASWTRAGLNAGKVSINAAPAEFLRDDYAERLLDTLAMRGVSADRIAVEVTEHVFVGRGADFVARAVAVLKQAGASISLDDFGTGYSSLSHLLDLQVDTIKIDKSFIDKVTDDGQASTIVAAIISLAKNLNITTVAEGVETEGQALLLHCIGCDQAQGYVFGKPGSSTSVESLIQGHLKAA